MSAERRVTINTPLYLGTNQPLSAEVRAGDQDRNVRADNQCCTVCLATPDRQQAARVGVDALLNRPSHLHGSLAGDPHRLARVVDLVGRQFAAALRHIRSSLSSVLAPAAGCSCQESPAAGGSPLVGKEEA